MRSGAALERLWQETRHAARRLRRSPAFSLATVLTLALAIGATASIFTVVYRVVLHPLPYGDPDRLVALQFSIPTRNVSTVYYLPSRLYFQYQERARTLSGVAMYMGATEATLTGEAMPERIRVSRTSSSLASVLQVAPAEGRWFTDAEAAPGASQVAVLSHGVWVRRFGRDPHVIGRAITLDGVATTIVGLMPASFAFPDARVDVWVPAPFATNTTATDAYAFALVGRLQRGATIAAARAELTALAIDLDPSHPNNGYRALVSAAIALLDATVGDTTVTLWTLLAAVGLVLLVACANVANLMLVRSDMKQREIAMRRALGAGRRAIVHYFLTESALISLAGGTIGLMLAWGAVQVLVALGPPNLPRLDEVRLDAATCAFTFMLSVVTALAIGVLPLIRFGSSMRSLRESGYGSAVSHGRQRARYVLMAFQVAMAMVLIAASGLMLRSFHNLRAVDPGFAATSALTFRIGLPRADYPSREKMAAAARGIVDQLSTLPGVSAVAASTCLPLSEQQLCQGGPLFIEGRPLSPGAIAPFVAIRAVSGNYFATMGTRVLRGRGIDTVDVDREEPIAVVNQALVNLAFGGRDPIGQHVRLGNPSLVPGRPEWLTIAGVVANTPTFGLAEANPFPQLYIPIFASRNVNMAPRLDAMSYVVRTSSMPASFAQPVRRAIDNVDSKLALGQVRTLQDILDRASSQMAFAMVLLAIAGGVSMALGMVGVYGAMSYIVAQRTGEIGVRLALGAVPRDIARMIVRQGGVVAIAGIVVGIASSVAGGRLIQSLLYGVTSRDPVVLSGTAAILLCIVLVACWLPARRGARLSPLEALRSE